MREQIAERIYDLHWRDGSSWSFKLAKQQRFMKTEIGRSYEEADEYISLLTEKIQKVRSTNPYSADEDTDEFFAFDSACVRVLKALEGVHDQSNTGSD